MPFSLKVKGKRRILRASFVNPVNLIVEHIARNSPRRSKGF
jgi:hypothetical protein